MIDNPEWVIVKNSSERHSKYYECCAEPYVDVQFNFTLKRQADMLKIVTITPLVSVIFATLVSFWLPSHSGEKIVLNGINVIVLTMLLKYFINLFPAVATNTPIIGEFNERQTSFCIKNDFSNFF